MLYGDCDFLKTMVLAANLGYDADCTASTSGAILGILIGEQAIRDTYNLPFDERIITGGIREGIKAPSNLAELTEQTLELHEILLNEIDTLPRLKKGFRIPKPVLPPENVGPMEIHRSFSVGVFDSYEEACISKDWKVVHTPTDILDLGPYVQDGKKIFVHAFVKDSSGRPVRVSPECSGAVRVWLNGALRGEDKEKDFAPSPHRSWATGDYLSATEGIDIMTEVTPRKDNTPLLFCILVSHEDRFHEITATICAADAQRSEDMA